MGKQRLQQTIRKGRTTATDSRNSESDSQVSDKPPGCPAPDPIVCLTPKMEITEDDSVRMTCTNEKCTQEKDMHAVCFTALEENLVKRLSTLGSARGWTDSQRRNNLWEKKGQALIGRFCRCRCGAGQYTLDTQAAYEKEKRELKKKKARNSNNKKVQLPALNFGGKPGIVVVEEKRKGSENGSGRFGRQRLDSDMSTSSVFTNSTFRDPHVYGESSGSGRFRNTSLASESADRFELTNYVPAPLPPQQTRSYASATTNVDDLSQKELHVDITEEGNDSGVDLLTKSSMESYTTNDGTTRSNENSIALSHVMIGNETEEDAILDMSISPSPISPLSPPVSPMTFAPPASPPTPVTPVEREDEPELRCEDIALLSPIPREVPVPVPHVDLVRIVDKNLNKPRYDEYVKEWNRPNEWRVIRPQEKTVFPFTSTPARSFNHKQTQLSLRGKQADEVREEDATMRYGWTPFAGTYAGCYENIIGHRFLPYHGYA